MAETFQRLFTMSGPPALSLNAQAALGQVRQPERSQFSHLLRHFLERFFAQEEASSDGDAKTRLVQVACAAGLPGFAVAVYLWPVYHPFPGWPPGRKWHGSLPPYWLQVNHHLFFVMYSFVALGIATVFEWDLFFPDLLDICVLGPLPVAEARVFLARVAAIAIFVAGFLFDANFLAWLVLPCAMDPPDLPRFWAGHLLAVLGSGLFAAVFVLALQGALLAALGERLFRRISLLLQGVMIAALVVLLLLFPVLSGVAPVLLQSGGAFTLCFPPFWFLGVYQRVLEGPSALPVYTHLAQIGCAATLAAATLAVLSYPVAYLRRVRQLVEGAGTRRARRWLSRPLDRLVHAAIVRQPVRRAVFHLIGQTLLRVPRYRIHLILYGGVGLSVVAATVLRFTAVHQTVRVGFSADGIRAALGIAAFWTIAGLRMAFVSPGNQRGSWVFRIVHGKPPGLRPALEQLRAAQVWVFVWAGMVTLAAALALRTVAAPELLTWPATASQILVAGGLCLLLTDVFFLNVTIVAFTGEPPREPSNLAFTVLKYYAFFPVVAAFPVLAEPWIERSRAHFAFAAAALLAAHLALRIQHRRIVKEHCNTPALEEDEQDFLLRLGLQS